MKKSSLTPQEFVAYLISNDVFHTRAQSHLRSKAEYFDLYNDYFVFFTEYCKIYDVDDKYMMEAFKI